MNHKIHMIFNTQDNKAHIGLMKTKHEQTRNVSVQVRCEDHNHEGWTISLLFLETRKHENHQNYLIFKVYVCPIQIKVYIHIQTQRVHKDICMKARGSKGCICITIIWIKWTYT